MESISVLDGDDSRYHAQLLPSTMAIHSDVTQSTQPQLEFYKHEPLPSQGNWIRLIRILPSDDEDVRCSIRAVELESATYMCLSYEWGEETFEQLTIILDGKSFTVRNNLYDFLKTAQDMPEYINTDFWIDAVCIDQRNFHEKNNQVAKMGSIFRNRLVLAWLGLSSEIPPVKSEELAALTRSSSFAAHFNSLRLPPPPFGDREIRPEDEFLENLELLVKLGNESYWQRAWVVQELKLARSVTLLSSIGMFDFQTLSDLFVRTWVEASMLGDMRSVYRFMADSFLAPLRMCRFLPNSTSSFGFDSSREQELVSQARMMLSTQEASASLSSLLKTHKDLQCSIKHDRIYSLLSLAPEGEYVNVDYAQTNTCLLLSTLNAFKDGFCLCTVINVINILCPSFPERAEVYACLKSPYSRKCTPTLLWRFSNHIGDARRTVLQTIREAQDELPDRSTTFNRRTPSIANMKPNVAWFTPTSIDLSTLCPNLRFAWTIRPHNDGGGEVRTYSHDHGSGFKLGSILEVKKSAEEVDRINVTLALSLARFFPMEGYSCGYGPCTRRNTNFLPFTVNDFS